MKTSTPLEAFDVVVTKLYRENISATEQRQECALRFMVSSGNLREGRLGQIQVGTDVPWKVKITSVRPQPGRNLVVEAIGERTINPQKQKRIS